MHTLQLIPLWTILFAISFLLALHPIYDFNWYAEKRFLQIIIYLFFTLSFLVFSITRDKTQRTLFCFSSKIKISLIVVLLLGVISSIYSTLPRMAFLEVGNFFLLFLLALFIAANKPQNEKTDKWFITAFVICVAGYLISFLASLTSGIIMGGVIDYQNLIPGVLNRRFLNQFQSISFPLILIAPLLFQVKKSSYIALVFLASFWFMMMLFSDGRGVVVGTTVGIVISGLFLKNIRILWWKHSVLVAGIGFILYLLSNYLLSFYTLTGDDAFGDVLRQTSGGRLFIWIHTLSLIQESPLLGVGPMHFAFQEHQTGVAHPHNITLQLMSEWGIPAALLIITLVFYAFYKWIRFLPTVAFDKNKSLLAIALSSAFIAGIVHGQFSGVFVMPLSQLAFALISGWMMSMYFNSKPLNQKQEKSNILSSILFLLFSGCALAAVLYGAYPQLQYLEKNVDADLLYLKGDYPASSAPRYWSRTIIMAK
jgi:O-antigen ligase